MDLGQTPKPTAKPDIHGKKMMLCDEIAELEHFEVLNSGPTVNANL